MAKGRFTDYYVAWGIAKREGTGGSAVYGDLTGVADADLDQVIGVQGRVRQRIPNRWNNANQGGTGSHHATDSANMTALTEIGLSGTVDIKMLTMLFMTGLGEWTTTQVAATAAYEHDFNELSSGLQLPSVPLIVKAHDDIGYKKAPGMCMQNLTLRGGEREFWTFESTMMGDGRLITEGAYTPVTARKLIKLRDVLSSIKYGTVGAPADHTANIIQWQINWAQTLQPQHKPGGTSRLLNPSDRNSPAFANAMLMNTPTITGQLTVEAEDDHPRALELAHTVQELQILGESPDEADTGNPYACNMTLKDVRVEDPEQVDHEGRLAWRFNFRAQMPASLSNADMWTAQTVTDETEIGAIAA